MAEGQARDLELRFHGRIVDQLAGQTYQSPIAALAEMVANGWDADAEVVDVSLPTNLDPGAEIVVLDDGVGMTFEEVQERYLEVGYNRRKDDPTATTERGRPLMGRKGIGKFAGFGIANRLTVDTVSRTTGERTRFTLDFDHLRGDSEEYVDREPTDIPEVEWWSETDGDEHPPGTRIELSSLKLNITPSSDSIRRSLARRFLLLERADEFSVNVDGEPISDEEEGGAVQFRYPMEWPDADRPDGLTVTDDGWGEEQVAGHMLRWQCVFYSDTIKDEELRGFAVFAHGKIAQSPFFFDFTGGAEGQQGQEYLSGKVEASFLDDGTDIISIERQRIDWNDETAAAVLAWGQQRLKQLLALWNDRRTEDKIRLLDEKVARFSPRLEKLGERERGVIEGAIRKLAQVKSLTNDQFVSLGEATLTAWEAGRLRDLIRDVAGAVEMSEEDWLTILVEHKVLTALNTAEAVRAKKEVVDGLRARIEARELENAVRDFISENPWLIDPKWDTFKVESSLKKMVDAEAKNRFSDDMLDKRVDLVLGSGDQLLVLEFMRPGLKLDGDHIGRFDLYVNTLKKNAAANNAGQYQRVIGYIVADELVDDAAITEKIGEMAAYGKFALDWNTLLDGASRHFGEFFEALVERAPDDPRIKSLEGAEARVELESESSS